MANEHDGISWKDPKPWVLISITVGGLPEMVGRANETNFNLLYNMEKKRKDKLPQLMEIQKQENKREIFRILSLTI